MNKFNHRMIGKVVTVKFDLTVTTGRILESSSTGVLEWFAVQDTITSYGLRGTEAVGRFHNDTEFEVTIHG